MKILYRLTIIFFFTSCFHLINTARAQSSKQAPKKNKTTKKPSAPILRNGFDVTNSSVPLKQIFSGGPPRDGIPAINRPVFINAKKALKSFSAKTKAIVVTIKGQHRAYPINILNWHEVVNDNIAQTPISITYCPLCGSGLVFSRFIQNKKLKLGVSGLLYQSDMLLYDSATNSLWSQLKRTAISGKLKGSTLPVIPSKLVILKSYLKTYPQTKVLSKKTGFKRSYNKDPYTGYATTEQLYFPIIHKDTTVHPKIWSLFIESPKGRMIIPLSHLSDKEGKIVRNKSISYNGISTSISYNKISRVINCDQIVNNNKITCIPGYFFALKTFYPKSNIYPNKN